MGLSFKLHCTLKQSNSITIKEDIHMKLPRTHPYLTPAYPTRRRRPSSLYEQAKQPRHSGRAEKSKAQGARGFNGTTTTTMCRDPKVKTLGCVGVGRMCR